MRLKTIFAGLMAAGLVYTAAAPAEPYDRAYDQPYDQSGYGVPTLEERVSRLEKRLAGNALMDMLSHMEKLQGEVLKLRGTVEELTHELEKTKRQQRDMYADLDQRLPRAAVSLPPATPSETVQLGSSPYAPIPLPGGEAGAVPPPQPAAGIAPQPPVAAPAPTPPPVSVAADPAARQAAYQKAFNTLKEGKYTDAIREFKGFTAAYPSGENTDSAYYWLAEAYYVNRDFPSARDTFRKVVADFPQSAKVPDASLKLGFIEYENGQYAAARDVLADVIKRYPGTSAAKMAEKRLERIRQEKH
jgi:tol-pal system protein YbgF